MAPNIGVIRDSLNIAKTLAKEVRAIGVKNARKKLDYNLNAEVYHKAEHAGKKIAYDVEQTVGDSFVVARDSFESTLKGKPRLVSSQLNSKTGEAHIYPGKKGFLGIGKKKGSIDVAQCNYNDKNLENMRLIADGTIENPTNPVLLSRGKKFILTLEDAQKFIQNVLNGKSVIPFQFGIK